MMKWLGFVPSLVCACSWVALCLTPALARAESPSDAAPGFEHASNSEAPAPGFDESRPTPLAAPQWEAMAAQDAILAAEDAERLAQIKEVHGFVPEIAENAAAFAGQFSRHPAETPELLTVDLAQGEMILYREGRIIARKRDVHLAEASATSALGLTKRLLPVRAVHDGTLQIMTVRVTASQGAKNAQRTYRVTLFKALGKHFGKALDRVVATGHDSDDASITPTATLTVERNDDATQFVWTPLSDTGRPKESARQVLRWNYWEGVFAVPRPAPTAPDKTKTRT